MWLLAQTNSDLSLPFGSYAVPAACGIVAGAVAVFFFKLLSTGTVKLVPPGPKEDKPFDPFVMGSPKEKRQTFRRGGTMIEVYFSLPDKKSKNQRGWVLDRSSGGLGLFLPDEYLEGTNLVVLPINAPEMTPWVELEVRSCRKSKEGFELGTKFVRTPPWTVLLMFG